MPKPLAIFLQPPFNSWKLIHNFGVVTPVPPPPATPVVYKHIRLRTAGVGNVRAAATGVLSARPFSSHGHSDPYLPLFALPIGSPLPSNVTLYLRLPVTTLRNPLFRTRTTKISTLVGFTYRNLDVATLEASLGALLDSAVLPSGSISRAEVIERLIRGNLGVRVTAGHVIGNASPNGAPAGERQFDFSATTLPLGLVSPSLAYDLLRDLVEDGQPAVDDLINHIKVEWPLLKSALSVAEAIQTTQRIAYPYSALLEFKNRMNLTPSQWRQVGNNQKSLYRERLLQRFGQPTPGRTDPPFQFDDNDFNNVFQLEAVVEFFANFDDPWLPGANPQLPVAPLVGGTARRQAGNWITLDGAPNLVNVVKNRHFIFLSGSQARINRLFRIQDVDLAGHRVLIHVNPTIPAAGCDWRIDLYHTVDLLDLRGAGATQAAPGGNVLTLDGDPDLTRLKSNTRLAGGDSLYDTIELESDTVPGVHRYRITDFDPVNFTVEVDGAPNLGGNPGAWRIFHRPVLIIIDPFGGRLKGKTATIPNAARPNVLELADPVPSLVKINEHFDTIYLASDTASTTRTYRITAADHNHHTVTLDTPTLAPILNGGTSRWHLQSGIGGNLHPLNYNLGPTNRPGWDHFDGMLYVVQADRIHMGIRWSSYTSHNFAAGNELLSSIRGNRMYDFRTYRSGRSDRQYRNCRNQNVDIPFRNYSIKVVDAFETTYDGVREARWYFPQQVLNDAAAPGAPPTPGRRGRRPGKTAIRLHYSRSVAPNRGCNSAGCLVSPSYYDLTRTLIRIHQQERTALGLANDATLNRLVRALNHRNPPHQRAMALYEGCIFGGLGPGQWNDKIVGRLWVIRPNERPISNEPQV